MTVRLGSSTEYTTLKTPDPQGSESFKLSSQILAEVWNILQQFDHLQNASNAWLLQSPQISQEASRGHKAIACLLCGV